MRILHISFESPEPSQFIGGRGIYLDNLLPLQAKAHEVVLATFGATTGHVDYKGVTLFTPKKAAVKGPSDPLACFFYSNQLMAKAILETYTAGDFDIIHCHDGDANICAQLVRAAWRLPLVATIHLSFTSCFLEGLTDREPIEKWLIENEHELFHSANSVIACSRYYQDLSMMLYQRRAEYIPNGVRTDFLPAGEDLPKGPKVFFAGRFCPQKGLETLLKVAMRMPDVKFVLAGKFVTNTEEEKLRLKDYQLLQEAKAIGNIVELGHVQNHAEIGYYAKQCDVWIAPSWHAPFELVGLEAFACGVPFVATKTGAFLEYCNEQNSVLVEPRDVDWTIEAVRDVIKDSPRKALLIRNGLKTVIQFSWDNCKEKTERVYERETRGGGHDSSTVCKSFEDNICLWR